MELQLKLMAPSLWDGKGSRFASDELAPLAPGFGQKPAPLRGTSEVQLNIIAKRVLDRWMPIWR